MKKLILASAISALSTGVIANESGPYFGVTTGFTMYEEQYIDDTAAVFTASANIGYAFNEYVSIEARMGTGLTEGELNAVYYGYYGVETVTADLTIDYMLSTFVKLSLPTDGRVTPYVLAGNTKGEATAEVDGYEFSEEENDFSYGIGFEVMATGDKSLGWNMEYIHYLEKNDTEISGFNVGIIKRF